MEFMLICLCAIGFIATIIVMVEDITIEKGSTTKDALQVLLCLKGILLIDLFTWAVAFKILSKIFI